MECATRATKTAQQVEINMRWTWNSIDTGSSPLESSDFDCYMLE